MAEEVEISNVGGDGVASEATLVNLLAAMRDLGGDKGKSAAAKAQRLYNEAQKDGIEIIDTEADSREKNTEQLDDGTSKLKKFGAALSDATISGLFAVGASLKNLTSELMFGGDSLSDFAQHIPLIGGYLGMLTGVIDGNLAAFRELSSVGARFGDGLNDIRAASASAAMPLDEFVNLVSENSMTMKMFGSDVASGARSFAAMSKELRDGPGRALMGLGYTSTELNELLLDYAEIQSGSFTRDRIQGRITAQNAAEFADQLNALSAATGKRRDQIMEEIKAQQADIRIRAAMSRYTGEEGERFRANIGTVNSISRSLADALVDFDDGIPSNASTQRLMQMSSTFRQFGQDVENMDPLQLNNFVVGIRRDLEAYAAANNTTVEELQRTIPGLESVFGIVGETATMAEMTREQFEAIQEAAAIEARRNDGLKTLGETVRNFRGALLDAFIESGVLKTVTDSFDTLATSLGDFVRSDAFREGLTKLTDAIKKFISDIENFGFMDALFGGEKTIIDPETGEETTIQTKGLFGDMMGDGGIGEAFGNFVSDAFANMLPSLDTVLIGLAAGIGAMIMAPFAGIAAVFVGIGVGIATMIGWDNLKEFAVESWEAITGMFSGISDWWDSLDLMTPLTEAWNSVTGIFTGIANWWNNTSFEQMFDNVWSSVTGIFTGIVEWFSNFSLTETLNNMWTTVTSWFSFGEGTGFSISQLASDAWNTVTSWFSFGDGESSFSISQLASNAWNTVTSWFSFGEGTGFSISQLASNAWNTVTSWFSFGGDTLGAIGGGISGLVSTAWNTITSFFNLDNFEMPSISNMFQGIIDAVRGFFTFDFEMPNFRQYLPTWLGGEGKSLFGDDSASATPQPVVSAEDLEAAAVAQDALVETQSAIGAFASIEGLQDNLDILKNGLDVDGVRSYTSAMEDLVEVLSQLNEELSRDNNGMLRAGTGENAGSVLSRMGSNSGGGAGGDEVNNTLREVLEVLRLQNTKTSQIEINTRARGLDISRSIS